MPALIFCWFARKPSPLEVQPDDAPGKHRCRDHPELCQDWRNVRGVERLYKWEACSICGRVLTKEVEVR